MTESEFNKLQVGDSMSCDSDDPLEVTARRVDEYGSIGFQLTRCGRYWYGWRGNYRFWARNCVIPFSNFGVINPKTGSRRVKEILSS